MIDVHAHLCFPDFNSNREEIICKCKKELKGVIVSSATYREALDVIEIVKKHKNFLFSSIGCHPMKLQDAEKIKELIRKTNNIVAIGEVGLDYHWEKDFKKRNNQKKYFEKFIELSEKLKKPLVLHAWDAEEQAFEMVRNCNEDVVFHCFSGTIELLKKIVKHGFYISFSTQVLFSKHHRKLVKVMPFENMLLETDSPFLSPKKSEPNYPWNIKLCAKKIATLTRSSEEKVLNTVKENAIRVFHLKL